MKEVKMFNYIPEHIDILGAAKRILRDNFNNGEIKEYSQNKTTYTVNYKVGDNKVVFLISYGKIKPNRCYNRNNNVYDDSILSDDVIHMTNQFIFVVYNNKVLCSDHDKRNIVLNLLHNYDQNFSCSLSAIPMSIEDFVQQVTSIDTISINATNDLFIEEFLNPSWGDDWGDRERPKTTKITMEFGRAIRADYLTNMYRKLTTKTYISSLDIKGKSAEGFISINEQGIVAKELFEFEKDEGYYDIEEIFKKV